MLSSCTSRLCLVVCILLATVLFSARTTAQDDNTYTYTYHVVEDVTIWDMSGTYSYDTMGCSVDSTITQDTTGKLTGQGTEQCSIGGYDIDASGTLTGTIRQSRGIVRVKETIKFTGTVTDGFDTYRFRASDKITAELDPDTSLMTGTIRVWVSVAGESYRETFPFTGSLAADMDGSFDLTVNLTRANKRLTGTGHLELSNGDTYEFSSKGTVSVRANLDKVALSSPEKQKFKLTVDRATGDITLLTGKVLGQSLKAKDVSGTITP